ncbi:MAG: hypothetical protein KBD63_02720 [Bacteriovoracaceae bacterium]|nr:hypothetical protein [Bacteriovoracaceae bacterium]
MTTLFKVILGSLFLIGLVTFFFFKNRNKFEWEVDKFADISILRYQIPSFETLSLQNKKLAYYLYQSGLSGRDIMYDQNFKENLRIRKTLEEIVKNYAGDRNARDFELFMVYVKRVWFSNGIHHHYSNDKFLPEISFETFSSFVEQSSKGQFPLKEGETMQSFLQNMKKIIFDPSYAAKKVEQKAEVDQVAGSSVNFYGEGITGKEVDDFYKKMIAQAKDKTRTPSFGLNSKLIKENGVLQEKIWKVGGMYSEALEKIVFWLEKAATVAENEKQKASIEALISFYKTGSLEEWDRFNILWVQDTNSQLDFIQGFVEVYNDPKGIKGSYESLVEWIDPVATKRMQAISSEAQWFEDHSPIMPEHKKEKVVGILGRAVNIIGLAGDSSPTSPVGVNLPNADWIRKEHGSKSVTLSNIIESSQHKETGVLKEFSYTKEEVERGEKYHMLAYTLEVDMHEVIGHASGKINKGVGTPAETLKEYASALEEARADLVALYYLMESAKLVELKLVASEKEAEDMAKYAYESYIRNGLQAQLKRIKIGDNIEEAHMRNRQLISGWVLEKGASENVVEKKMKDGKTYFVVNDFKKLQTLFGNLLKEIQRIKSEGDYTAGKSLVENYGVKVDLDLHKEVLARLEKYKAAPYSGYLNPKLVAVEDASGNITDVKVEYLESFEDQMLEYSRDYSFLPMQN